MEAEDSGIPVFIPFFTLEEKRKYRKISVSDMILRDNKEAMSLLQRAGHQLSGWLIPRDGFINSIRDPKSPVKPGLENVVSAFRNKKGVLQVPDEKSPSSDARNELAYTPKERVTDIGGNVKK